MKFLVLGGGAQGSAAAYDLLRDPGVDEVVIADRAELPVRPFLQDFLGAGLSVDRFDVTRSDEVRRRMEDVVAVLCALPYGFNFEMARLAVECGVHFADLGGNTEIVRRQRTLDESARDRGVSVIPDCGLAPGLVNVLAQWGIDRVESVEAVRMWVGGLPRNPRPPLNYQVVYSLEGVLDYYTTPGVILREGEPVEVEPLTGVEEVRFPDSLGVLEAFHTAGGASTLPARYRGRIRTLEYKTLRYPGHALLMRGIRDLGLLDTEPVEVDGVPVSPRQMFIEKVGPRLREGDGRDAVALRVEVEGRRPSGSERVRFELVDLYDERTGLTAMMRCTGFSLSLTSLMQVRGEVSGPGVRTPDEALVPEAFVGALRDRGLAITESWSGGPTGSDA